MTKDEKLLVEIYRSLDPVDEVADPYAVGEKIGFKEKLVKNILQGLMQANLVKRYGPNEVGLTERGREVVSTLIKKS